jgi:hypothetical protein
MPAKSLALMGRVMQTEASTAAWQAYLWWNGLLALIAIVPALLVANRLWRRQSLAPPTAEPAALKSTTSVSRSAAG